jgi:hypothetical protein
MYQWKDADEYDDENTWAEEYRDLQNFAWFGCFLMFLCIPFAVSRRKQQQLFAFGGSQSVTLGGGTLQLIQFKCGRRSVYSICGGGYSANWIRGAPTFNTFDSGRARSTSG